MNIQDKIYEMYNKLDKDNYSGFDQKEKILYNICKFESEMNNGGFDQYFLNDQKDLHKTLVSDLQTIKADRTSQLGEKAIEAKESLSEEEAEEMFDELDSKFYKYEDDLSQLLADYLNN